ncbi:MAG: hypothetical protein ACRDCZ_00660, partial [Culicoidibacterales bacterium]
AKMKKILFDYGLLSTDLVQNTQLVKVSERAVGFGKLFTDGEKPVLLNDGDDNDKFYGQLYEVTLDQLAEFAKQWPEYHEVELMAYTSEGMMMTSAFAQTKQQIQKLTYLDYPEWK